jgi:NodT family efflux transporter outer membrane factor (OMF) lipoprotein
MMSFSSRMALPLVWRAPLMSALAVVLAACASQGSSLPMARPLVAQQLGLQTEAASPALPAHWWQVLGDPALDALIERALRDQPDLGVAAARVAQADAAAQVQAATDGLQLQLSGNVTRQRFSAHGLYPEPLGGNWWNTGSATVGASWELNYLSTQRAALAAALGLQQAQTLELAAARVQLAAQISRVWLGLAQLLAQRELALATLQQREQILALIRQRVGAGLDTTVELRQGEGALPDARVQIEVLAEQIQLARHQLATLSGQAPDALLEVQPVLPQQAFAPDVSQLGLDLLARRPEVQAARWRVEAATRGIDSIKSQFYPNIRLTAFIGLDAIGLGKLLQGDSRQLGFGPALHLPLFDAGRLRGLLRGREAELNLAVGQYNAVVLASVREAADAVASRQSLLRQQAEQAQAQRSAESAYDLALQRYKAGLGSYLLVLNVESQVIAQRRQALDLRARVAQSQVALMKSLGGGWQADTLLPDAPTPGTTPPQSRAHAAAEPEVTTK